MPPTLHHKRPFHVGLSSGHDSLTVEAINRLWNRLQTKSSHVLEMQPPLGANRDPPMQWQSIEGPVGALTPLPNAQGSSTTSPLPTNTPLFLSAINRGVPCSCKASQVESFSLLLSLG